MADYIIMSGNAPEHYFYRSGIYMKRRSFTGVWQDMTAVVAGGRDGFSVYRSKDGNVHLICVDHSGNMIYAAYSAGEWKKYVISKLNSDISVSEMRLYGIRGRLNLLYSAIYNGENLLVHCILGDHAKPSTVDTLESPHFFVKGDKVYYTNANGVLGFVDLSDEKPSVFTPVYEDAHFGTVYDIDGKERILFARNSSVFLDGQEIAHDTHIEMPVLVSVKDKFYVMWKNSGFVRYSVSIDCKRFGQVRRFMTSGRSMKLYSVQKGNEFSHYYGYDIQNDFVLLGNPEIFEVTEHYSLPTPLELEKVKNMLNKTERDISEAKKELARLGKLLGTLSK